MKKDGYNCWYQFLVVNDGIFIIENEIGHIIFNGDFSTFENTMEIENVPMWYVDTCYYLMKTYAKDDIIHFVVRHPNNIKDWRKFDYEM